MEISRYVFQQLFGGFTLQDPGPADEAILHVICMAIHLDGRLEPVEVSEASALIASLYEFEQYDPEEIQALITRTIEHIRHMGPELTLSHIAERLSDDASRQTALRVAAYLSLSDGRVSPVEALLVQSLSQELGLTQQDVIAAWDEVQHRVRVHEEQTRQNPWLAYREPPRFEALRVEQLEPSVELLLRELRAEFAQLCQALKPTWDGLIVPLERLQDRLGFTWGLITHLLSVQNSASLRDAYQRVQPALVAFSMELGQSPAMYEGLKQLQQDEALTGAQRRVVESLVKSAEQSGVGLQGVQKARFNAIQQEMAELGTQFSNAVLDSVKAFELWLTQAEQAQGLPPSFLKMAAQSARQAGHEQASAEQGPWRVTLDGPSLLPFLRFSARAELREAIYRAYIQRASDGEHDNTARLKRILELRREEAALLGYDSFAQLSLSTKMASSVEEVEALLERLRVVAWRAGVQDMQELEAFVAQIEPQALPLHHWDVAYWSERLREHSYGFSEEELRPYFQFPHVLAGLYALLERLFGIRIRESAAAVERWHEDVRFYEVHDAHGEHIASFYMDPYSRPETKRGGAWFSPSQSRSAALAPQGQSVRLPVGYVVCNQTPPVDGQPSLMTFNEVLTLFHEFGHALQHMLTRVECSMIAGINGIEWDAVELPSQFMENWCYQPEVLRALTSHVDSGEPISQALIDKLLKSKNFRAGSAMLRQIYFGLMDMELHHRFDAASPAANPFEVQARFGRLTSLLEPLPEDRFLCSFTHVFAGGYAAGYYSYKWAEVLSADAFGAFEEAGLEDDVQVRQIGTRFRDTVLALGGSQHPMEVFASFRGRPPEPEALLRHHGLLQDEQAA